MTRYHVFAALAALSLAGCGLLEPVGDSTKPLLYGSASAGTVDPATEVRMRAAAAMIDRGAAETDPAKARDWIEAGVALLR